MSLTDIPDLAPTNFTIRTGDTVEIAVTVVEQGEPVDITGRSYVCHGKKNPADVNPIVVFTTIMEDPDEGQVMARLTSEETENLAVGYLYWDFREVIPSTPPVVTTLIAGRITVALGISS